MGGGGFGSAGAPGGQRVIRVTVVAWRRYRRVVAAAGGARGGEGPDAESQADTSSACPMRRLVAPYQRRAKRGLLER